MIHKLRGRFRSEHLIDPVWDLVAQGHGEQALEGCGIIANDAIMACVREQDIHGLCEQVYRQEVARHEPGACIPFALARNATAVVDVLVASHPGLLLDRAGHDGMSLATFCAISGRVETLDRLDAHLHLLDSCVLHNNHDQPLYASCYSRLPRTVRWLLEHGFDPNEKGEAGRGVLHRLAGFNRSSPAQDKVDDTLETIGLLLEHGADPCLEDVHGHSCINADGWMCDQVRRMVAERSRQGLQASVAACNQDHGDVRRF